LYCLNCGIPAGIAKLPLLSGVLGFTALMSMEQATQARKFKEFTK